MRALPLSLVGTVIIAMLASLGPAAAADRSDLPIVVSGTHTCGTPVPGFPTSTAENGAVSFRGRFGTCTDSMNDPLVSGIWRQTLNAQCAAPSDAHPGKDCVFWGAHLLDNPSSGWDCTFAGFDDPSGDNWGLVHGMCEGYDGYEGLHYIFDRAIGGVVDLGDGTSMRGVVYAGPPLGEEWPLSVAD
jgi:hypothetical protein